MPFEFKRLNEIENKNGNSTLVYGSAKSGKTHFAASSGSRTLILDNGNGLETIQSPYYKEKNPDFNPIVVRIPTEALDDMKPSSYDAICDAIDEALVKIPNDFDTIVLDDASAFRMSASFKALETAQKTGKSQGKPLDKAKEYNIIIPNVQEYDIEMKYMLNFVAGTIDLLCKQKNKNFIMLCHERVTYDKEKDTNNKPIIGGALIPSVYRPAFTGVDKNPDQIAGLFDWVLHSESQSSMLNGQPTKFFYVRTSGDSNMMAEMRGVKKGMFPERIQNPNYLKMLEVYRNGGEYK